MAPLMRAWAPFTLQATVDRLTQLYAQCKSWGGPQSSVLYLGLYQEDVKEGRLTAANDMLLHNASLAVG